MMVLDWMVRGMAAAAWIVGFAVVLAAAGFLCTGIAFLLSWVLEERDENGSQKTDAPGDARLERRPPRAGVRRADPGHQERRAGGQAGDHAGFSRNPDPTAPTDQGARALQGGLR